MIIFTVVAIALTLINWIVIIGTDSDMPRKQDGIYFFEDKHISIPTPIGIIVHGSAQDQYPCGRDFLFDAVAEISNYNGLLIGAFGIYIPLVLMP